MARASKQGTHSVGVARQYLRHARQAANCQVAVTVALWTGARAWMLGASLYLPEAWLTPEARPRARIPATVRFQEKWRLALTLLRQVRAERVSADGRVGRRRIRGQPHVAAHAAPREAAVCVGGLVDAERVCQAARARWPRRGSVGQGGLGHGRCWPRRVHSQSVSRRRGRAGRQAWRSITWRNGDQRAPGAPASCARRVTAGARRGDSDASRPKSGCSPSAIRRRDAAHRVRLGAIWPATASLKRGSCGWRISAGRSSSSIKSSRTNSVSLTRLT